MLGKSPNALLFSAGAWLTCSGCVQVQSPPATAAPDAASISAPAPPANFPANAQTPAGHEEQQQVAQDAPAPAQSALAKGEADDRPPVSEIRPPECKGSGTRSEGWYRGEQLLIHASCQGETPECRGSGTRSEGWYAGEELIEHDQCDGKLPEAFDEREKNRASQ